MAAMAAIAAAAAMAAANKMSENLYQLIVRVLILVAGILAIGFGLVWFFFLSPRLSNTTDTTSTTSGTSGTPYIPEVSNESELKETLEAARAGDYEAAITNSNSIQSDPKNSAEAKALATFSTIGAQYRLTADTNARLIDIRNMKKIILDRELSLWTRVNTLNALGSQYSNSGRDPAVFAEIYKDAPFETYLVPGDPDLSARHLAEWSYEMMPTSFAAIGIARWYTEQYITNPNQAASVTASNAAIAEDYLKKADAAALEEAKQDSAYPNSTRYLVYRYWRAMIIARLAVQKGEPYVSQYKAVYNEFIKYGLTQRNVLAKDFVLYARLFFAQRLTQEDDQVAAKAQLDLLAQELRAVATSTTSVFVQFLKNESRNAPTGPNWTAAKNMSLISPNFKAEVEKVLASSSQ